MTIVGICGKSGSGKSTVGKFIKETYSSYIDCDIVSRNVTKKGSKCLDELTLSFGKEILFEDGTLNRSMLASIAFGSDEKTKTLNLITHKYIIQEIELTIEQFASKGDKVVFLDAPTLFESGLDKKCNFILTVVSDEKNLIERIRNRDGKSDHEIKKRLSSQVSEEFLINKSDFVIVNNGTLEELKEKTISFIKEVEKKI